MASSNLGNLDTVCRAADTIAEESAEALSRWRCPTPPATSSPPGWRSGSGCAAPT
ncbi:hypothetical protein NKH77_20485 [Streptomyces sp. M19]